MDKSDSYLDDPDMKINGLRYFLAKRVNPPQGDTSCTTMYIFSAIDEEECEAQINIIKEVSYPQKPSLTQSLIIEV